MNNEDQTQDPTTLPQDEVTVDETTEETTATPAEEKTEGGEEAVA